MPGARQAFQSALSPSGAATMAKLSPAQLAPFSEVFGLDVAENVSEARRLFTRLSEDLGFSPADTDALFDKMSAWFRKDGQPQTATAGGPSLSQSGGPDVGDQVMRSQSESPDIGDQSRLETESESRSGTGSSSANTISGLVNVVEEEPGRLGRSFARFGAAGNETFGTRLLHDTETLEIGWTDNVRQLAGNIAEIQSATGVNISRITGNATDGVESIIRNGNFNSELYAQHLARRLGGQWVIDLTPKGSSWSITARRI